MGFTGIEKVNNWEDNGVFSDLPKPIVLNQNTNQMNLNIEEEELTDEIAENEVYRVNKTTKGFIELTRYTLVEGETEEESYKTSEVRIHDWVYYSAEECLEKFEELWLNSYVWEEVLLSECGLKEVVINRKHNEIVLSQATETFYTDEEGTVHSAKEWTSKYFPLYPLSTSDLMEQFEDFWELDPRQKFVLERSDVGYEIAGQILEDGLDLGEGYENLIKTLDRDVLLNRIDGDILTITTIGEVLDAHRYCPVMDGGVLKGERYSIRYNVLEGYEHFDRMMFHPSGFYNYSSSDDICERSALCVENTKTGINFYLKQGTPQGIKVVIKVIVTKTSTPKPFIKNSRPDSKLALPQLSSLGELESLDQETGVAQHEQGTVIFKQPQFDPNAPHKDLVFGAHAHKVDGKWRLLCKAEEEDAKIVGYNLLKYEDESDGSSVFYDVGRTSTANNIAGKITVDGEIYIGEGYENLNIRRIPLIDGVTTNVSNGVVTIINLNSSQSAIPIESSAFSYDGTITLNYEVLEGSDNFLRIDNWGKDEGELPEEHLEKKGSITTEVSSTTGRWQFQIIVKSNSTTKIKVWATPTSTPKPYTDSSVPEGRLAIEKPWSTDNKTFVWKNVKSCQNENTTQMFLSSTANGLIAMESDIPIVVSSDRDKMNYAYSKSYYKFVDSIHAKGAIKKYLILNGKHNSHGFTRDSLKQILIYKGDLGQTKMEAELAKSIDLSSYHFQENSVINTYGIKGFEKMYVYDKLTEAEVAEEVQKDMTLKERYRLKNVPNYLGETPSSKYKIK